MRNKLGLANLLQLMCAGVTSLQEHPFGMTDVSICRQREAKVVNRRIHGFNR